MSKTHTFESNGPDGKIRGTAQQVLDKYLALGSDATTSSDPISAEGYFVLMPDIVYEPGRPGPSALDAVEHALDAAE